MQSFHWEKQGGGGREEGGGGGGGGEREAILSKWEKEWIKA